MPTYKIFPVDDMGLRYDLPTSAVKWTNLRNCVFDRGRVRKRPGSQAIGAARPEVDIEHGPPVAIAEIKHPNSAGDNYSGIDKFTETVRPDATSSNNWDLVVGATAHECVDDDPPDMGATRIETATDGNKCRLSFGARAGTADSIPRATLRFAARNSNRGMTSKIKVWWSNAGEIDTVHVTASEISLDADYPTWQIFSLPMYEHPTLGIPFRLNDFTNPNFQFEKVESTEGEAVEFLYVNADGAHTDFGAYGDMQGGSNNESPLAWFADDTATEINALAEGAKQSFGFKNPSTTFASVDSVEFRILVARTSIGQSPHVQLFHRGTDSTDRDVGDETQISAVDSATGNWGGCSPGAEMGHYEFVTSGELTTNPEDDAAWADADLDGLEFGIEIVHNYGSEFGHVVSITAAEVIVKGTPTGGKTQIDWVALDIDQVEYGGRASGNDLVGIDRLFLNTKSFLRLDSQGDPDGAWTDITNSLTSSAPTSRKWDHATFFNRIYFVNGRDQIYFYPDTGNVMGQMSGDPRGHTIASFGSRLLLGDTLDASGNRTQYRIAYSGFQDPDDWTGASAGTIDLLDTNGSQIINLTPFTEDICMCYCEVGVYRLLLTGQADIPIIRDLYDSMTGAVATMTVEAAVLPDGRNVHFFLGRHVVSGLNVYMYDGRAIIPVGDAIRDDMLKNLIHYEVENSFLKLEPRSGSLYLFVPETTYNGGCRRAYVLNLKTMQWTDALFDADMCAAGEWTLQDESKATGLQHEGEKSMILGKYDSLPYYLTHDVKYDVVTPQDKAAKRFSSEEEDLAGHFHYTTGITQTIETGDLILSDETHQASVYSVWIYYYDRGVADVELSISTDGGKSYTTATSTTIGTRAASGEFRAATIDLSNDTIQEGHRNRIKLENTAELQEMDIAEIYIKYEPRGERY